MATPTPGRWQASTRRSWLKSPGGLLRKRRIGALATLCLVVYLFIKFLPTDVPSVGQRIDVRTGRHQGSPFAGPQGPPGPPGSGPPSPDMLEPYDGPIKFYNLASSLRYYGSSLARDKRDNVLFVLFDLQSAATILSTACSMATYNRTNIHIALLDMYDVPPDALMSLNNVPGTCADTLIWHDARPDHNAESSPERVDNVITSALGHIHASLKFPVVLLDSVQADMERLKTIISTKLSSLGATLVVIPNDATTLAWTHTLDGASLATLPALQIDIVIQPYKNSAGSLIKLLNSIKTAHYGTLPKPRVTVILPQDIDPHARRYLDTFSLPGGLVLHRTLDPHTISPNIGALKALESFYPPSLPLSHVLVLNPDFELDANYLQFLFLTTLEYKYAKNAPYTSNLAGVSLQSQGGTDVSLHQHVSPAMLYFGDKWVELQDYVTLRLERDADLSKRVDGEVWTRPSYMALTDEWLRARDFWTLSPGFDLGVVHGEATQVPEELVKEKKPDTRLPKLKDDTVLAGDEIGDVQQDVRIGVDFVKKLGRLKDDLPMVSAEGKMLTDEDLVQHGQEWRKKLSLNVGGCKQLSDRFEGGGVRGLFCKVD